MSDSVEFRHLEYLLAIYERKNFTKAAERVYRSQPEVSQQVRALEEDVGFPIFIRGGRNGVFPTSPGDVAPVEIIGRAGRIIEHVDRALEAKFEEFQISRASFDVLVALQRNGKPYQLTQRELMRSLFRTSGSMSLRIDSLKKQGFVERKPDTDDRRSVFVKLTRKGIALLEVFIPEHFENENSLIAGLVKAERAQLITLLRKWMLSLEEEVAHGRQLYLGMTLLDSRASTKMRRAVGLPDVPDLLVNMVAVGSRSEELGFRKGDLVCAIEGRPVTSLIELRKILNKSTPKS